MADTEETAPIDHNPDFDWSKHNFDVVQQSVQRVAVYINPFKQVVVRQERDWDEDDDTWIVLAPEAAIRLSERLRALAQEALSE